MIVGSSSGLIVLLNTIKNFIVYLDLLKLILRLVADIPFTCCTTDMHIFYNLRIIDRFIRHKNSTLCSKPQKSWIVSSAGYHHSFFQTMPNKALEISYRNHISR